MLALSSLKLRIPGFDRGTAGLQFSAHIKAAADTLPRHDALGASSGALHHHMHMIMLNLDSAAVVWQSQTDVTKLVPQR